MSFSTWEPSPPPMLPPVARAIGYAAVIPARPVRPIELPINRLHARVDLFLVLLLGIALPIVFDGLLGVYLHISRLEVYAANPWFLVGRKVLDMAWVTAIAIILLRARELPPASFGFTGARPWRQVLFGFVGAFVVYGAFFLSIMIVLPLALLIPPEALEEQARQKMEFLEALPLHSLWMGVLLMIPVAIHEEVLFRGLLLPYLRRAGLPWGVAIAIGTLIFASLHFPQGLIGMFQVGLVGLALSIIFVRTGALYPVIFAHFFFDSVQFALMQLFLPYLKKLQEQGVSP